MTESKYTLPTKACHCTECGGGNTDDWTDPPHSRAKVDSSKFNAHSFHNWAGADVNRISHIFRHSATIADNTDHWTDVPHFKGESGLIQIRCSLILS